MYQFLNCVDRPSKTGLTINNVQHAFSLILPPHLLRVCSRMKRSKQASLTKVSASRKCLQAKKKKNVPIGEKRHHTSQYQNNMLEHLIWLLWNRGKLWEGPAVTVIASFESSEICDI